jgi:hypothetical protein
MLFSNISNTATHSLDVAHIVSETNGINTMCSDAYSGAIAFIKQKTCSGMAHSELTEYDDVENTFCFSL